ncbi:hypothetical protein FRC14_002838 [Serendipita sp. 396]|nr:hypothetical protein FRC14_002838 [Serendipita sp. 396]KAG8824531.1 hypothetical protein FRC19_001599 [Serendipita sp. 401]
MSGLDKAFANRVVHVAESSSSQGKENFSQTLHVEGRSVAKMLTRKPCLVVAPLATDAVAQVSTTGADSFPSTSGSRPRTSTKPKTLKAQKTKTKTKGAKNKEKLKKKLKMRIKMRTRARARVIKKVEEPVVEIDQAVESGRSSVYRGDDEY